MTLYLNIIVSYLAVLLLVATVLGFIAGVLGVIVNLVRMWSHASLNLSKMVSLQGNLNHLLFHPEMLDSEGLCHRRKVIFFLKVLLLAMLGAVASMLLKITYANLLQ